MVIAHAVLGKAFINNDITVCCVVSKEESVHSDPLNPPQSLQDPSIPVNVIPGVKISMGKFVPLLSNSTEIHLSTHLVSITLLNG